MGITAKELAKMLGLSASAVSLALNNKPGVSKQTRAKVLQAAREHGYDFSSISEKHLRNQVVELLICVKYGTVAFNMEKIDSIAAGVLSVCKRLGLKLQLSTCYEDESFIRQKIEEFRTQRPAGVILLAPGMSQANLLQFRSMSIPMVLLGRSVENAFCDSVMVDNEPIACAATGYLIQKCQAQPGYLRSAMSVQDYDERAEGFFRGVRQAGMSPANSVVHRLAPTMEGALQDMLDVIEQGSELAKCYFADSELIAAGAVKALRLKGYRVPEDISVICFNDSSVAESSNLTTMKVSAHQMGMMAVGVLNERIRIPDMPYVKVRTSATMVVRGSVAER